MIQKIEMVRYLVLFYHTYSDQFNFLDHFFFLNIFDNSVRAFTLIS